MKTNLSNEAWRTLARRINCVALCLSLGISIIVVVSVMIKIQYNL